MGVKNSHSAALRLTSRHTVNSGPAMEWGPGFGSRKRRAAWPPEDRSSSSDENIHNGRLFIHNGCRALLAFTLLFFN